MTFISVCSHSGQLSLAIPSLVGAMSAVTVTPTGAALPENNEAPEELTTANGGTFTSSSASLSSQSR